MVETRHVEINYLFFECPIYYQIGNFPSSDEVYNSIVALSHQNRECELYVMAYREHTFDYNAIRNRELLKRYLTLQGYYNISNNPHLINTYNANIDFDGIPIKSTIAYNFNNKNVITVVGNVFPFSNYRCNNDIKTILDTVKYIEPFNISYLNGPVKCYDCGFEYNSKLHDFCPNCGSMTGIPLK